MTVIVKVRHVPLLDRGGSVVTTPLVTTPVAAGTNKITSGMSVYPVGTGAPMHSHNCDEHVTVLEGEAEVLVEGEVTRLAQFDTTYIPSPLPHHPRTRWVRADSIQSPECGQHSPTETR